MQLNGEKEQEGVWPKGRQAFGVVEGQVTHAGSVQRAANLMTRMEKQYRVHVPVEMRVQVVDDYAHDVTAPRTEEPWLKTMSIRNGLAK